MSNQEIFNRKNRNQMRSPVVDVEVPKEDTPLVAEGGDIEQGLVEPSQLKPIKDGNTKETLVGVFGAITFLTSAAAMLIYQGLLVIFAGLFGVFLSPFAAFQQFKITQTIAMAETNAFFQKQLDILKANNERLTNQVADMTKSVDSLKDMEMTLGTVQAMSGNCLQQLEEQLRKQREIAAMTKTNVTDELVGNIFEIALNSDENGDMNLSDEEVEKFVKRMEGINGVDVREEKVKAMIANHGRGITSLMDVAKNFLKDDIPEEDKLFIRVD